MILLDTNALLWLQGRHKRSRPLSRWTGRLYISPANLLEIQSGMRVADLVDDPRWSLDDPPVAAWFAVAQELSWTRDPFDRLLAAHSHYRGWKLATGDGHLIEQLGADGVVEL